MKGFEDKVVPINTTINGWYFGNILIGGAIGLFTYRSCNRSNVENKKRLHRRKATAEKQRGIYIRDSAY